MSNDIGIICFKMLIPPCYDINEFMYDMNDFLSFSTDTIFSNEYVLRFKIHSQVNQFNIFSINLGSSFVVDYIVKKNWKMKIISHMKSALGRMHISFSWKRMRKLKGSTTTFGMLMEKQCSFKTIGLKTIHLEWMHALLKA